MSSVKFKLDTAGVRAEVLQADYMLNYIEQQAEQMCDADSHVKSFIGFDRAKAIIYPDQEERNND